MDKHFNEFSFKVIHCFKPIPHCQWKKSSVDWHWVGSLYWWYTDFPPPSQSWMGCLVKVFSASTSLPLILPMVPQALWAGHRGHGSDLQVCTHNSISLVSILLDINSIDLSYWKVSNNFTSPSFLWIIVHIYVLTQIKNDGDLRMQRFVYFVFAFCIYIFCILHIAFLTTFFISGTSTSWWACQCWSLWSPWSTGQCRGREPLLPSSSSSGISAFPIFSSQKFTPSSQLGHHCRLLALVPLPQVP